MAQDPRLQTAARALARSRRLAVFTGAGVSKESGIATFREPETGLWARYDPMQLATPEAYGGTRVRLELVRAPVRRGRRAEPNPGHWRIAELEQLLPKVVVVTQNIDGLHQRAGSARGHRAARQHAQLQLHRGRHRGTRWDDFADQEEKPPRCPRVRRLPAPRGRLVRRGAAPDAIDARPAAQRRLRRDARSSAPPAWSTPPRPCR